MDNLARESDIVFRALADPTRREILAYLGGQELPTVGDIAKQFPRLGRTAVSSHLRILRDATLVEEMRDGQSRRYSLVPNRADTAISFLQQLYSDTVK